MNLQPTLESDLIRIRPMDKYDLEDLYKVAKDPKIWEQHHCKRYLRPEFEKFFTESIESNGALIILDKTTNKIIGSSRYKKFNEFPHIVEIGWTFIDRKYWGGKYNKVVKNLMIEHAFNFASSIIFYVNRNNIRSQRAVEKIGGQKIVESEFEQFPHTSSDNVIFVIRNKKKIYKTEKPAGNST
jgi:RimJ/RimL family protein N-acetyltransferase